MAVCVLLSASFVYGSLSVDGSLLNENFESTAPVNGSIPTGWIVGGGGPYMGVRDLEFGGTLYRGFYLVNTMVNTNGYALTPNMPTLGDTFGVEFDFALGSANAQNFTLLGTWKQGYPEYNKFYVTGNSTDGYALKNIAEDTVATIDDNVMYHLLYTTENGTYTLYLDGTQIASGACTVRDGQSRLYMGSNVAADGGSVFYDNFSVTREEADPYIPAESMVAGNTLNEDFESIAPADGAMPTDWILGGNDYQYMGVRDLTFNIGGTLRGFHLVNIPVNTNGHAYTPELGDLGSNYGVEFDFAMCSTTTTAVNFILFAAHNIYGYYQFNKFYVNGNSTDGYDLLDLAENPVAHLTANKLYRLAYITTDSTYKLYLDGVEIASGSCTVRPSGNAQRIFMGGLAAADGGAVFYDNFKVDVYAPTQQNRSFDVPAISAINVDGDLSDWTNSSSWSRSFIWWNKSGLTSTTKAKFAYNDEMDMLYVAIETDQANGGHAVVGMSKNIDSIPNEGIDSTQLGFTSNGNGTVTIVNEPNELLYEGYGGMITTGVEAVCSQLGGVWTYEIAIPLWKVWTDASQGKEDLTPGDKVYLYAIMQDVYGANENGMNMTFFGNPAFSNGAFDEAAELSLMGGKAYPMGWCSSYPNVTSEVPGVEGANIIWSQWWGTGTDEDMVEYLDLAQSLGVKVILQLPQDAIEANNQTRIATVVSLVGDHPAIYAFELSDEPPAADKAKLEAAYATVKSLSNKPVTITFDLAAYNLGVMGVLQNAYDIIIQDTYPHYVGQDEFDGCLVRWIQGVNYAKAASAAYGKPFMMMAQGFGNMTDVAGIWRLSTYNEERFCSYWAVLNGAQGILHWIRYKATSTPAMPDEPYPYNGTQWITDVLSPVMNEFSVFSNAFANGGVSGAVTSSNSNVKAAVYADDDGNYFLVAANKSGSSVSSTLTLNLPFTPAWAIAAGSDPVAIQTSGSTYSFSASFTTCKVLTYQIVPASTTAFTKTAGIYLVQDFNAITEGDGSVPANWSVTGNGDQYIGSKVILGKRGLYLENTDITDGLVSTPNLGNMGDTYYVDFDFALSGNCQNFWLLASKNSTSGVFNKIMVSGTQLYDLAGTSVATLTTGTLYHLSYVTDNGSYRIYLDGTQIASGTSATGNAQQIVLGTDITADGGSVFYDNFKVGTIVPTGTPVVLTPGDANKDGVVNVGDLGILAANYGRDLQAQGVAQAEWWGLGDFNGDGTVNVGDLGILAANYGSSGSSFEADYAKVFGTAATEDESDETDSFSFCSGLGLPLIAGLMLMGLMMVKNEE